MRKTFKYLMSAAVLVAGFAGCSREVITDVNIPGGNVKEGVPTYATFNFVVSGSNTKAAKMSNDKAEKDSITDIRLIIFKTGASIVCEVNKVYNESDLSAPNAWDKNKSKTVQLTSGKKRIFVITNAEKRTNIKDLLVKIQEGTTTLSQFYDIVYQLGSFNQTGLADINGMKELIHATDGYIMSNPAGSNSSFDLEGGVSLEDSRNNKKNSFEISIQRTIGKVAVYYDGADVLKTLDKVGTVIKPEYTIRNVNSAAYLFQKFASDAVDPTQNTNIPRSPFYSLAAGAPYDSIYYNDFDFIPMTSDKGAEKIYVTENTSENPRNATTTYAAVRAGFIPYKNMIIESYVYNELTNAFSQITNPSSELASPQTLYRLVDIGTSTGIASNIYFTDKEKAYKAAYLIKNKSANGFDINKTAELDWDGTKGYIVEYPSGISYYRLNLGEDVSGSFLLGIRRNYAYLAKITSFAGAGMPKLEDLDKDPEKPIGQKTHVTATIKITPWTDVSSDYQL
ncbi:MAG: Mfa1 family fimbria major subunit [Tannerellaceae bacterium]|jgi:hypothetical protein|nr:Mfa1 family fimbria major subunit [Tannerellaceae bacterium]